MAVTAVADERRHCSMMNFVQGVEGLSIQAFIPELAAKAFVVAALPATAGLDEQSPGI